MIKAYVLQLEISSYLKYLCHLDFFVVLQFTDITGQLPGVSAEIR